MNTILYATFDGEVLRPDLPVRLPPNTRVRVMIETTDEQESSGMSFLDTAEGLNLEGPADWSFRLEEYLCRPCLDGLGMNSLSHLLCEISGLPHCIKKPD